MCYETNLIAFVGNKPEVDIIEEKFNMGTSLNYKVLSIWNDDKKQIAAQFTFQSKISNLFLTKEQIYVVLKRTIYIYNLFTYQNIDIIQTFENAKGYFAVTENDQKIAYPDKVSGYIRIRDFAQKTMIVFKGSNEEYFSLMTFNTSGELLATANREGTTLFIFNTENGRCLQELKRGRTKADILSICFDENDLMVSATSHQGTVHIWSIQSSMTEIGKAKQEKEENQKKLIEGIPQNKFSLWKNFPISSISSKFQTEKSFAQMHLPHERTICAFNKNERNQIIAIGESGVIYIGKINTEQGAECAQLKRNSLVPNDN